MLTEIKKLGKYKCGQCGGMANWAMITFIGKCRAIEIEMPYCEVCDQDNLAHLQTWHSLCLDIPKFEYDFNLWELLYDIQDGHCLYCGIELIEATTGMDHIIGVNFDRTRPFMIDVPSNFALVCRRCNSSKCNRWYEDWIRRKFPDNAQTVIDRVCHHMAIVRKETGEGEWRKNLGIGDGMLYEIK